MILAQLFYFKQRIFLWLLGQALPDSDALKRHIRMALLGVMAAVVTGVLVALVFTACMAVLYIYLTDLGYGMAAVFTIIALASLTSATLMFILAKSAMEKATDLNSSLKLFGRKPKSEITDTINLAFDAFLEGLMQEQTKKLEESVVFTPVDENITNLHPTPRPKASTPKAASMKL